MNFDVPLGFLTVHDHHHDHHCHYHKRHQPKDLLPVYCDHCYHHMNSENDHTKEYLYK